MGPRDLRVVAADPPAQESAPALSAVEGPSAAMPPADPKPPVKSRLAGLQGTGVTALAIIVVIAALKAAAGFFIPIAFALVFSLALARPVRRLESIMPRCVAAALVVTLLTGAMGFVAYSLSDETARAIAGLPRAARNLRQAFRVISNRSGGGPLAQLQQAVTELQRTATESTERPSTPSGVTAVQVVEPPVDFTNAVWLGSQGILAIAGQATLIVFLVYFLLASGDLFKRKLVRLSGDRLSQRKVTVQVIDQITERVTRSFHHLVIAGIVVGLATWGALALMGVPYAGLWGLAAGILNCVPYLGPAVVAAGLLLATLAQSGHIGTAVAVAAVSVVITTVEGSLFTPIVFGKTVRLNPVAIFISFLFWGWVWGVWGMLLALPLLMMVKTIAESVEDLRPLAELLSD